MKKKIFIVLLLILTLLLSSCGSKKSLAYENSSFDKTVSYEGVNSNSVGLNSTNPRYESKLVYSANLNIETVDFDKTTKGLIDLVKSFNGYFERSSKYNGGYFDSYYEDYSDYLVRIPVDNYSNFIEKLSEENHITFIDETNYDIGKTYYETKTHIETLEIKIKRLQELLKSAKDISDIITIEDSLTDAEFELEEYMNELENYDQMVSYSTISISVRSVSKYEGSDVNFFKRFLDSIVEGLSNAFYVLEDFILWIGYNLILVLVLIAAIIVSIKLITKKKKAKTNIEKREDK